MLPPFTTVCPYVIENCFTTTTMMSTSTLFDSEVPSFLYPKQQQFSDLGTRPSCVKCPHSVAALLPQQEQEFPLHFGVGPRAGTPFLNSTKSAAAFYAGPQPA
eukprot:scaffold9425_cov97-Cylindrotheca_fusiformis.AAC.3